MSVTSAAFTTTTTSPSDRSGEYVGLSLPCSSSDSLDARRPTTSPRASTRRYRKPSVGTLRMRERPPVSLCAMASLASSRIEPLLDRMSGDANPTNPRLCESPRRPLIAGRATSECRSRARCPRCARRDTTRARARLAETGAICASRCARRLKTEVEHRAPKGKILIFHAGPVAAASRTSAARDISSGHRLESHFVEHIPRTTTAESRADVSSSSSTREPPSPRSAPAAPSRASSAARERKPRS